MSTPADMNPQDDHLGQIKEFVASSSGLRSSLIGNEKIEILQCTDGKAIAFHLEELDEVIRRIDSDGHLFLQVNFRSGKKILLTQNLIGFKPAPSQGLDLAKLPKVVTTPDLLSVVEAIEDSLVSNPEHHDEVDVLRKVFDSVLRGGEAVGFDLTSERVWLQNIGRKSSKATA